MAASESEQGVQAVVAADAADLAFAAAQDRVTSRVANAEKSARARDDKFAR